MKVRSFLPLAAALCLSAQTIDVGTGSASLDPAISRQFVNAFFRNGFSNLVSTPPVGPVKSFGETGLIQEFEDSAKTPGVRLALIKPNTSAGSAEGVTDVFQVRALIYAYYGTVGVNTAGFPTTDTAMCLNTTSGACFWQQFNKNYALFAYSAALSNGSSTFALKDPFFTEWTNRGGITTIGAATSAETAVTSPPGSAATMQSFQSGIILNITAGTLAGRVVSVQNPVYAVYVENGGPAGFLGFPTGPEQIAGTKRRQSFEGGSIEYEPGQGGTLRLPVSNVSLSTGATAVRLKLNETFNVEAVPRAVTGEALLDRTVTWVTTNGRVVSIQSNGRFATIKGVGGGVATVTAVSEGKISPPIAVSVQSECCQVGEGAPSPTASQAFADAVTRTRLALQLPSPTPVRRVGNGYQQEHTTVSGARVILALPDRSPQVWVLAGPLLTAFEAAGGAAGPLGYPSADPTSGGRQLFEGGALAGTPVQFVSGGILARWALLGYETGAIGPPTGASSGFSTFAASSGLQQLFRDGLLAQVQTGALAGKTFVVTGPILTRYRADGGPGGRFGSPINDEFVQGGVHRQDFEGGYLEYATGGAVNAVESGRKPLVSVFPASAVAGSRIRLAVGGFPDGSALRVSITGQPDFVVPTVNGSYAWDAWIPVDTPSRAVTVRAALANNPNVFATTTYAIRSAAEARPRLTKVRGDAQSGAPGALLPIPLRVNLRDESGSPLVGAAVVFVASPGAQISPRSVATDANGNAEAALRLPPGVGIALATAEAARQIVTFTAQSSGSSISNFPHLPFEGNSYVGSAAAILKFYQDRGELAGAVGSVTAASLDSYLRNFCVLDLQANQICDGYLQSAEQPNLWRSVNFAGGGLELIPGESNESSIRETVSGGSPVLVSLRLSDGTAAAVVATGVSADGGLQIMDPNPRQPRKGLADYLSETATIAGALRFVPRVPASAGFLLISSGTASSVSSPGGACGPSFGVPGSPDATLFVYCDGTQPVYQAQVASEGTYRGSLTDLSANGPKVSINGLKTGAFRVFRSSLHWEIAPLEATFQASAVLNAASSTQDFAPGAAISIYGLGLAGTNGTAAIEVGGRPAQVLFSSPFQVNAVIPLDLVPGSWPLRLSGLYGSAEVQIEVRDTAPGVFRLSDSQAAVTNQDGSLNTSNNPAARGQVIVLYGTGFGAVQSAQGALRRTISPVSVVAGGLNLPVVYAGLTPGSIGLYQVNVQLLPDMPPSLFQSLEVRQGGTAANRISVAIR